MAKKISLPAGIRPCFCGATPGQLAITEGSSSKYAWAACEWCGEWSIEFRTNYSQDLAELQELAAKAWNNAPRNLSEGDLDA
jgi:hypothetical protein